MSVMAPVEKVCDCVSSNHFAGKPKDFSDGDLLMAVNLGLPFQVPEVFFKGDKSPLNVDVMKNLPAFNPKTFFKSSQSMLMIN